MHTKQPSYKSFSDSALLIAFTTGLLFVIGYLHEGPFLEKFGLNSEEFIPDSITLITYGFKYLFINLLFYTVAISFVLMVVLTVISSWKKHITKFLSKHIKSEELISLASDFKPPVILAIILISSSASVRIIADGQKEYSEYLKAKDKYDILITKENKTGIKGKVIRFHKNKIAFWDINNKIAIVIPDSELIELKYSVLEKQ